MNQSKKYKPGYKHWKECLENPRRPVIKWHVLQVKYIPGPSIMHRNLAKMSNLVSPKIFVSQTHAHTLWLSLDAEDSGNKEYNCQLSPAAVQISKFLDFNFPSGVSIPNKDRLGEGKIFPSR